MNKNDILRRIRYTFDLNDSKMISIFDQADHQVTRAQVSDWLKRDDDPACQECSDMQLAIFLNGLINEWAKDDKAVDSKLAEFKKKNGGRPPNILYILVDDIGFGDLGIPEMNAIRGYKTPNIN